MDERFPVHSHFVHALKHGFAVLQFFIEKSRIAGDAKIIQRRFENRAGVERIAGDAVVNFRIEAVGACEINDCFTARILHQPAAQGSLHAGGFEQRPDRALHRGVPIKLRARCALAAGDERARMHRKLCALQFQHGEDANVIIPLQRGVVRDKHRQAAGEMVITWREYAGPALLPTLLEAVELLGKIRAPAHHICLDFWRICRVPVTRDKFNFIAASRRQRHVPAPVNNAVVISHSVGFCRGTDDRYKARPLAGIEHGYSIGPQNS